MTEEPSTHAVAGRPASARDRQERWVAAGVLLLLSLVCCTPLMEPGWFHSHEQIRPIARALGAWYEIANGDLYPRWLSTGYLGKGVPLFNFYSPAFSLLVAYGHALGVPLLLAAKSLVLALFWLGAWGVYRWVRPHLGHFPALFAAILYLYAPYHFVDLYVRGATAEFTALAALPYLFLAIDGVADRLSARGLASLAAASAAIVLSHFLSALMIAPFAAAYALVRVVSARQGWRGLSRIALGGALGAALSAFYWLPALVERSALSPEREERTVKGYNWVFHHFVHPTQWLDPTWGFGASMPEGYADGMSFQVGLLLLGAVAASALLLLLLRGPARGFVALTLALGLAALWLTSGASRGWYALVKPYQLMQFPWRFLGPVTLFFAAAGGGLVRAAGDRLAERLSWLGPALASAAAIAAIVLSVDQRTVQAALPVADDREAIEAVVAADAWSSKYGNEDEFLPIYASEEAAGTEPGGPFPGGLGVEIGQARGRGNELTFDYVAPVGDGIIVVPWHYFPGWKVSVDGRPWACAPGPGGLINLLAPRGRHVVRVWFGTTPARVAGWLAAVAGLGTLAVIALRDRRRRSGARPEPPRPRSE